MSDLLGRVDAIEESSTTYVSYAYNGLGRMVEADYEQPEIRLQYTDGDVDDDYEGLDRFGRVIDQQWYDYDGDADVDRFLYDHDRVGNPTYRDIPSGLYASNDKDQYYEYDDLHRLSKANEGTLTGTPYNIDDANADFRQKWGLDQLGNWADFQEDANGDNDFTDAGDLDQDRTSNDVNEITNITEGGSQAAWVTPAYDDNGNMDQGPSPADGTVNHKYIYDAWNRLVEVTDNSDVTIATYEYDGLNRRIVKDDQLADPDVDYDYFYNESWQIVEVRKDDDTDPLMEMVWHDFYIDAPAYRHYDANTDGTSDHQYFAFDATFNVTALTDGTGDVLERYEYSAYGESVILDSDFSNDGDGVSDYEQHHLFAGYRFDLESGLYEARSRLLHPTQGRWMQRDPSGHVDGCNLYQYARSKSVALADAMGSYPEDFFDSGPCRSTCTKAFPNNDTRYVRCLAGCNNGQRGFDCTNYCSQWTDDAERAACEAGCDASQGRTGGGVTVWVPKYDVREKQSETLSLACVGLAGTAATPIPGDELLVIVGALGVLAAYEASKILAQNPIEIPRVLPIPQTRPVPEQPISRCDFYKLWCDWGDKLPDSDPGKPHWEKSISCNLCYLECKTMGRWPFDQCPIPGPRHPDDDPWDPGPPVLPD